MSNITKTYSGDFTSYIAGKLLNAAGMAKGERERRETQNIEKAQPGSLFAKALQSEFGGDLYNRTLGNLDPRKKAAETDRKSSKEARYRAQFPTKDTGKNSEISDAERELLKDDDDSIPVKDIDKRENLSKLLGAGLDARLMRSEARTTKVANGVGELNSGLLNVQNLIFDQTELLSSKFDQMFEIFSQQNKFQKKIAEEGKVRRREQELELEKDLSTTRKIESIDGGRKKGDFLGKFLGVAADLLRNRKGGGSLAKKLAEALAKKSASASGFRAALGAARALYGANRDTRRGRAAFNLGKNVYNRLRTDTLEEAIGLVPKVSRIQKIREVLTGKPVGPSSKLGKGVSSAVSSFDREMLANVLEVPVEKLDIAVKEGGFNKKISQAAAEGLIDPSDVGRLKDTAKTVKNTNIASQIKSGMSPATGSRMGSDVSKKLMTAGGADLLEQAGKKGSSKVLGKAGKFVPGLGTGIALTEAAYRFSQGDTTGGILSLGSAIPILGWGFTAVDIARDLGYNPMGLPEPPEYERGTELAKRGPAILHGTELVLREKDREDLFGNIDTEIDKIGSHLVSASMSLARDAGSATEVQSLMKASGIDYDIITLPLHTKIGKGTNNTLISASEDIFGKISNKDDKKKTKAKRLKSDDDDDDDDDENNPPPSNKKLEDFPEYDIEYNEPNSIVRMGNKLYRTNELGGLEEEITLDEANRIVAASSRPNPRPRSPGANGSYASGTWIGPAGDNDGEQTGLNMNLPGGIGTPIYAPVDLVYKSRGTDGNPSVGLQGTPDALGPQGRGFGYYGAYYFQKDGREYEVLMGHFKEMPLRGETEGQKIPKGTLIGYQGASGRSVSRSGGVYPHISLHVNAVDISQGKASNDVLRWFADGLAGGNVSTGNGGGGGGERISRPEKALLKTIAFAEGTTGSYGTIFGGKVIPELERGDMTVREVYNMMMTGRVRGRNAGYAKGSYATGRYQFMPHTLKDIVEKYGALRWSEKFTKEAQDRAILARIANFRGVTKSVLEAQGLSNDVLDMLSGEFASFPTYEGVSAYNQPVKSQAKLRQMYKQFLGSIKAGPKIVGPKIVGPGKVGAGIPLIPDLTIQKLLDAIQTGIKDGLNQSGDTFNKGLIPKQSVKPNQLQSNSSIMEEMEENSSVQQIYIINNVVAASPVTSPVISSSGGSKADYVDQYRMAVLGA